MNVGRWFYVFIFADNLVDVSVKWNGHFVNQIHEQGQILAEIEQFPVQFKDIEDDGILMSKK